MGASVRQLLLSAAAALLAAGVCAPVPAAEPVWLTIIGDQADAKVNTIQVDPTPIEVKDHLRVHRIRVSRSELRTSPDGVKFRSFQSRAVFDCREMTGRYLVSEFFDAPLWQGPSSTTLEYPKDDTAHPLAFRGITPNPNLRIIKAACQSYVNSVRQP